MKTQINNLINGSENTIRNLSSSKYNANPVGSYSGKTNVPQFGGTPTSERKAVAAKVAEENPGNLIIEVRGIVLTLARHNSLSGKSWSWEAEITPDQYTAITGLAAPAWSHKGADNKYSVMITQDCTVEVYAASGKKGFARTLDEAYVAILDDATDGITADELRDLLSFQEGLTSVEVLSCTPLADDATLIIARLAFAEDDALTVSLIHYDGEGWLFTPADWQGWQPSTAEEVGEITWRVNDTDCEGTMIDGLPRLIG